MEETIFYEGYAPGGVALLVEAVTDNRNRSSADVRSTMTKSGATPGEPGSVAWKFDKKGLVLVDLEGTGLDAEEITLQAIDAGAEDVEVSDDTLEIYTEWTELNTVRQALADQGLPISEAEITMRPQTIIALDDDGSVSKVMRLLEKLEDLDDVQRVYSDLDMSNVQVESEG
jgi:YebC/PmpR family DNA-binding regulatory protein